jgi:hypothetical protein
LRDRIAGKERAWICTIAAAAMSLSQLFGLPNYTAIMTVAQVPSIVVPEECNFLLNPAHPLAATLVAKKIRRWTYDGRL